MQANGAEMMRLAVQFAHEKGIKVCAPIHDALLIEADESEIDQAVAATQEAMTVASQVVLDGNSIRTDFKIIRYPERLGDDRGLKMWREVQKFMQSKGYQL